MWNDIGWCTATKDVEVQNDIGWRATAKGVEVWNDKGKLLLPIFFMTVHMKFDKIQFVYIDMEYLEYLHGIDGEIWFDKENENYRIKPHLGILINNDGRQYVIPLTSAKDKHRTWDDVTASWYRIYEIIDITRADDVIVEIKNQDILKKLDADTRQNYKQRILSVLDMRKMFPVDKRVYQEIQFNISSRALKSDNQRMFLMIKEYNFLKELADEIEKKTTKIYDKQIAKNKVLKYHCDYRKLEKALDEYRKEEI